MAATPPKRQTLPRWQIAQEGDATTLARPARSAKIIQFPGGKARGSSVVTYPAKIVLPARRVIDPVPPATPRDRRMGFAAAVGLSAAGLLLLMI